MLERSKVKKICVRNICFVLFYFQNMSSNPEQYCLRWNNYQNNLLGVFNRLLGSEQFTDVLLAAEGRTLKAHKVK